MYIAFWEKIRLLLILCALSLNSCVPSTPPQSSTHNLQITSTVGNPSSLPQEDDFSAAPSLPTQFAPLPFSGDIYFAVHKVSNTTAARFGKLSATCLFSLEPTNCAEIQWFESFPAQDFTVQSFAFSPDGTTALITNAYDANSLLFSANPVTLQTLNLPVATNTVVWSPSGEWVAVSVNGVDPETSQIMLIDRTGQQHTPTIQVYPIQRIYPLGWYTESQLLVGVEDLQAPVGQPNAKKETTAVTLLLMDVNTSNLQPFPIPLTLEDLPLQVAVAPHGTTIALARHNGLWRVDPNGKITKLLNVPLHNPVWSPNSLWIAAFDSQSESCTILVQSAVGGEAQKFALSGACDSLVWLPSGSESAIVLTRDLINADETFYLLSLQNQTVQMLQIPGLLGYFVDDIDFAIP